MRQQQGARAWPDKTTRRGGHGSVSCGDRYGGRRDRRGIDGEYVSRCMGTTPITSQAMLRRSTSFGPTCRLTSSPEVGPRATVGTLKLGVPLTTV
jgi:hypothetical protein